MGRAWLGEFLELIGIEQGEGISCPTFLVTVVEEKINKGHNGPSIKAMKN